MSSNVEIKVSTTYDGSGVQQAESDLEKFKRLMRTQDDANRQVAAELTRLRQQSSAGVDNPAAQAYLRRLDEEKQRTVELGRSYGVLLDRKRDLIRRQDELIAQGKLIEAAALQPELIAITEADRLKRRDPFRMEEEMYQQVGKYNRWRGKAEQDHIRQLEAMYGKGQWQPITPLPPGGLPPDVNAPPPPSWWSRNRGTIGRIAGRGVLGAAGLAVLEGIRGMPIAEDEAHLRFKLGAPGTRGGMGVDEFGREVAEAGRAMHFTRQATLQAAEAYSQVAGRMGKQLTPEIEQLAQAARYHRKELAEFAEYAAGFRRLTRADDPQALQRILGIVRGAYDAGGARRDEILPSLKILAERAAQGRPEGMSADALQIHDAMLRALGQTKLPGFEGDKGREVWQGMFGMRFDQGDPQALIRYRLLTGTQGMIGGSPFDFMGKAAVELERINRGDLSKASVDRIFSAFQRAPQLTHAQTPEGQAKAIQQMLGVPLSLDQIMKLRETVLAGGGRAQFDAKLREVTGQQVGTGPEAAQLKADYMKDQQSRRAVHDAMGKLGRGLLDARNWLTRSASDAVGGGVAGDFAALGVDATLLAGGFGTAWGTFRGVTGLARATRGFGLGPLARNAWNFGKSGAGHLRKIPGLNRIPGLGKIAQYGESVAEAFAAAFPELRAIQGVTRIGGRAALPLAAILGAVDIGRVVHGSYKYWGESEAALESAKAAGAMRGRVYFDQDTRFLKRMEEYHDPKQVEEAKRLYQQRREQDRTVREAYSTYWDFLKLWGKPATGTKTRTEKVTPGAAMDWAQEEMERRHGARLPDSDLSDVGGPRLDDLGSVGRASGIRIGPESLRHDVRVQVDVRVSGDDAIAQIGKQLERPVREAVAAAMPNIYEPISSSRSNAGRLS